MRGGGNSCDEIAAPLTSMLRELIVKRYDGYDGKVA